MLTQDELDRLLQEGPDGHEPSNAETAEANATSNASMSQKPDGTEGWADAFAEAAAGGDAAAAKTLGRKTVTPQPRPDPTAAHAEVGAHNFDDFEQKTIEGSASNDRPDLDFILDLPLNISVELGRHRMPIRELLQLGQGAVVELNKVAGEPAEIYVNQQLMAKGEVVVVNEKFGIRLTEIISPADRVKSLG